MFFKVLAAIVTADAFDRHMREQQHRVWVAEDERASRPRRSARDRVRVGADHATA